MNPEPLEEWRFDTRHLGRRVLVFDELDSTNEFARQFTEPVAIIALHQTAGRGRFGRVWRSGPGSALLMSVVIDPPKELKRPSILTAWAAVAVAEAVKKLAGLEPVIKWPNDLLVNGQKICGILIEQAAATVVGIGLNLSQTREEFDAAGLPMATSLLAASFQLAGGSHLQSDQGKPASWKLAATAETVIHHLDDEYQSLISDRTLVEAKWRDRTGLFEKEVEAERSDGTRITGRLVQMTFDELELETKQGRSRIAPETVEHVRIANP